MELDSQKDVRVALDERKPVFPNFRVLGQPVTSEVRSTAKSRYWRRIALGRYQVDQSDQTVVKLGQIIPIYPKLYHYRKRSPKVSHPRSLISDDLE